METNTKPHASEKLKALATTVSSATIKSMNDFLDVTGYVYGIVNLVAPAVTLEPKHAAVQTNYDSFRTNLSAYQKKAGLWMQPTAAQPNDIITQITIMPRAITSISKDVMMDIAMLVNLTPKSPAFHTFAVDLKAKVTSANQQVDNLVAQITTFKADVDEGSTKMTEAYNGILADVDAGLAAEISGLQVTIDSLNRDVRAAQKKIKVEQTAQDAAITAIAVGSLTAWIGIGTVALAAGIAGLALTKKEIASLNATIAADKLKIKTDFNALKTDEAAKALVVLFQNAVVKSLEAHDKAIQELRQFSSLLKTLEAHINEALRETIKGTTPKEPDWFEAFHQAFLEWQATNKIASALKEIKIAIKPMGS